MAENGPGPETGTVWCHCGRPLHYNDRGVRRTVDDPVDRLGPDMIVTAEGRSWRVQRHYIALHGLRAADLPALGFPEAEPPGK